MKKDNIKIIRELLTDDLLKRSDFLHNLFYYDSEQKNKSIRLIKSKAFQKFVEKHKGESKLFNKLCEDHIKVAYLPKNHINFLDIGYDVTTNTVYIKYIDFDSIKKDTETTAEAIYSDYNLKDNPEHITESNTIADFLTKRSCLAKMKRAATIKSDYTICPLNFIDVRTNRTMKPGKSINRLFNKVDKNDIDLFVTLLKNELTGLNKEEEIFEVRGKAIPYFYNRKRTEKPSKERQSVNELIEYLNDPPLRGSCMRHDRCTLNYLDLYAENPDTVSMYVIENKKESLVKARCLVWKAKNGNNFFDRIYYSEDKYFHYLFRHLVLKGFKNINGKNLSVLNNKSNENIVEDKDKYSFNGQVKIYLKNFKFKRYPYMDTLKYLNTTRGYITNKNEGNTNDSVYIIQSAGGNFDLISGEENLGENKKENSLSCLQRTLSYYKDRDELFSDISKLRHADRSISFDTKKRYAYVFSKKEKNMHHLNEKYKMYVDFIPINNKYFQFSKWANKNEKTVYSIYHKQNIKVSQAKCVCGLYVHKSAHEKEIENWFKKNKEGIDLCKKILKTIKNQGYISVSKKTLSIGVYYSDILPGVIDRTEIEKFFTYFKPTSKGLECVSDFCSKKDVLKEEHFMFDENIKDGQKSYNKTEKLPKYSSHSTIITYD